MRFSAWDAALVGAWGHETTDPERSSALYEYGLHEADALGHVLVTADIHVALGRLAQRVGDRRGALAHVETGLVGYERWPGARRDRAEQLLRDLQPLS